MIPNKKVLVLTIGILIAPQAVLANDKDHDAENSVGYYAAHEKCSNKVDRLNNNTAYDQKEQVFIDCMQNQGYDESLNSSKQIYDNRDNEFFPPILDSEKYQRRF